MVDNVVDNLVLPEDTQRHTKTPIPPLPSSLSIEQRGGPGVRQMD